MKFPLFDLDIPCVDTAQMIEVDRLMIEEFHIDLMQMMENAGRSLAKLARTRFLTGDARRQMVLVMAGTGGNGGGALVAARHLHNAGAIVNVVLARPAEALPPVPAHQLDILERIGVPVSIFESPDALPEPALVLDGLIGYSLKGDPRGSVGELIYWANGQPAPILALDVPSGVDSTSGRVAVPAIRSAATMTLALPKKGLLAPEARAHTGELYLVDIGVPVELYACPSLSLQVPKIFATGDLIRLR